MQRLINNEILNNLKLNYSLFSLSKDPVGAMIFWVKNNTGPESIFVGASWECELVKSGYINNDGSFNEKELDINEYVYDAKTKVLTCPIVTRNVSINNIRLKSRVQLILEYAEFLDFNAKTKYVKDDVNLPKDNHGQAFKSITTTTVSIKCIEPKNPCDPWGPVVNPGEERYIAVVFPNAICPPLIRVYNDLNFDIVKIDDCDCAYNSYFKNINEETSVRRILDQEYEHNDIPVTKYDSMYKVPLSIYGQEFYGIENCSWEIYSNETIDLNISYNSDTFGCIDIRFGSNSLIGIAEKCLLEDHRNIKDHVNFMIEASGFDITPDDVKITRSKISSDNKFNRIRLECEDNYIITLHSDGYFSAGILYTCDKKLRKISVNIVDLINQCIISTAYVLEDRGKIRVDYSDIKNLAFSEYFNASGDLSIEEIFELPVDDLVWEIHKQIESATEIDYSGNDSAFSYSDGKLLCESCNILNDRFARGMLGELIKLI